MLARSRDGACMLYMKGVGARLWIGSADYEREQGDRRLCSCGVLSSFVSLLPTMNHFPAEGKTRAIHRPASKGWNRLSAPWTRPKAE